MMMTMKRRHLHRHTETVPKEEERIAANHQRLAKMMSMRHTQTTLTKVPQKETRAVQQGLMVPQKETSRRLMSSTPNGSKDRSFMLCLPATTKHMVTHIMAFLMTTQPGLQSNACLRSGTVMRPGWNMSPIGKTIGGNHLCIVVTLTVQGTKMVIP